jgi:hypothetical protein
LQRDWRQFRLLSRDAIRRLLDAAMFSPESDGMEFAIWMLALIATPPAFFAANQIFLYAALVKAPQEVVEQIALGHRLFFVVYGMLATTLLAALTWESLFPDGSDQEIVGVLPVRAHTYAAARLGAAISIGVAVAAAINLPAAFIYTMIAASHPSLRNIPGLLAGHIVATMMGSMAMYFSLLTIRGLAAVLLGVRAGAWLGTALQLISVVLLVEVFFFLPGVLSTLVRAMLNGDPIAGAFPPVWFASVHNWIGGNTRAVIASASASRLAAFAFIVPALATVPVYLLPAKWLGRRALERRSRHETASVVQTINAAVRMVIRRPAVRAIVGFSMASLLRSRRHLLVLATYLGLAIATCVASVLIIEVHGTFLIASPTSWVLALPLVFQFFLVGGLRASFRIPTDIQANWPFRLARPTLTDSLNASVWVIVITALVPIAAITMAVTAPLWSLADVLRTAGLQALGGLALIEVALIRWTKVPFACEHLASPDVFKAGWLLYAIALYNYAFQLSDWQAAALRSTVAMTSYLGVCVLAIAIARVVRRRQWRGEALEFDAVYPHAVERLNLSGRRRRRARAATATDIPPQCRSRRRRPHRRSARSVSGRHERARCSSRPPADRPRAARRRSIGRRSPDGRARHRAPAGRSAPATTATPRALARMSPARRAARPPASSSPPRSAARPSLTRQAAHPVQ